MLSNLHKPKNKSVAAFLENNNKNSGMNISVDVEIKEDDIFFEDDFEVIDLTDKVLMLNEKYNFTKYKKIK